jgi:hypothetical protein
VAQELVLVVAQAVMEQVELAQVELAQAQALELAQAQALVLAQSLYHLDFLLSHYHQQLSHLLLLHHFMHQKGK